jgi:hypothetical protein
MPLHVEALDVEAGPSRDGGGFVGASFSLGRRDMRVFCGLTPVKSTGVHSRSGLATSSFTRL